MFYEYALIPDIFDPENIYLDTQRELALVQLLDGVADNAMVANFNKGALRSHIGELVNGIPSEYPEAGRTSPRKDIQECLEILDSRNRFVRHPASQGAGPSTNNGWLELALLSHSRNPFDGIVLDRTLFDAAGMRNQAQAIRFDQLAKSKVWRSRRRDVTLEKRRGNFATALAPILRHAKKVTLIDPHIDPRTSRWLHILEIVGSLTGNRGWASSTGWNAQITIHAGDPGKGPNPQTPQERMDVWSTEVRRFPSSFRVTVCIWGKDISGPEAHDRFVITNQCGVSCPGGLDCYPDNSESSKAATPSTWSLLSEDAKSRHLADYEENSGLYSLLLKRDFKP